MTLKRWTLILILAAFPAVAGAEQPLKPGDILATSEGPFACFNHPVSGGFLAALYRRGSVMPSRFSNLDFGFRPPYPTGPVTYSPALNRVMAVNASSGALIAGPWWLGGGGKVVGIAVAGEWRAAEQPVRGRAVR